MKMLVPMFAYAYNMGYKLSTGKETNEDIDAWVGVTAPQ